MNDSEILHMAQARELLTTYTAQVKGYGRQAANEWLSRQLARMPKSYDMNRVRVCMRKAMEDERCQSS
jgi:hypothetical protein